METDNSKKAGEEKMVTTLPVAEKIISQKKEDSVCCGGRCGFNFGRLFLGIILLVVGLFYLGRNMGIIPDSYNINIWMLWPVLIIYFGLSMIGSRSWLSTLAGAVATFIILVIVMMAVFMGNINNFDTARNVIIVPVNIARDANAVSGVINIKSGAGKVYLTGGASGLVEGSLMTNFADLNQNYSVQNGIETANLEIAGGQMGGQWNWPRMMSNYANDFDLKVNSQIPLSLYLTSGAADINIDASDIMLERAELNTGAARANLTMGDKVNNSSIKIDAGVSDIKIHVPQNVGVKLNIDGGLNSKKLDKFIQIDEKNYESENYSATDKKLNIEADLGVSGIGIDWR